jgi:hypothetical protein
MADVVPTGHAPYYSLLWRSSTLYLPALVGFVTLASAVLRDARRVIRPTWGRWPVARATRHSLEGVCRR